MTKTLRKPPTSVAMTKIVFEIVQDQQDVARQLLELKM
jgi:hypothetical protein